LLLFSTAVLRLSNCACLHFLLFALSIANSPLLVAHAFFLFCLNGQITRRAVDFTLFCLLRPSLSTRMQFKNSNLICKSSMFS
jgi:hypothetical protein